MSNCKTKQDEVDVEVVVRVGDLRDSSEMLASLMTIFFHNPPSSSTYGLFH